MISIENFDIRTHIVESIVETFDTMVSMEIEVFDSELPDVAGVSRMVAAVNFAGHVIGQINIHVTQSLARLMMANMLEREPKEVEDDGEVKNMLAEIINNVGGNLKSAFTDAGLSCALSTPSFTTGTDFEIESLNMEIYERLAFRSAGNIVFVEMGVKISEPVQAAGQQAKDIRYSAGAEQSEASLSQDKIEAVLHAANQAAENTAEPADESTPQPEVAGQEAEIQPVEPQRPPTPQSKPRESEKNEAASSGDFDLDLLLDIPLEIKVELGRTRIQIQELLNLAPGSALKLVKLEGEPVDILANDTLIAKGEVVVQNEKYGIRVTEITSRIQRIRSSSI